MRFNSTIMLLLALPWCYWLLYKILCRLGRWLTTRPSPHTGDHEPSVDVALIVFFVGPWVVAFCLHWFLPLESRAYWILITILLYVCALAINTFPNHSRSVKYLLMGSGGACLAYTPGKVFTFDSPVVNSIWAITFAIYVVIPVMLFRPSSGNLEHDRSRRRAARWHRIVTWWQGADPVSLLAYVATSIVGVSPFLLTCRYLIKIRLSKKPVLYLRSFSNSQTSLVFSQIVAPAVYRFLPLTGWVHRRQSTVDLQSKIPSLWWSRFSAIPDEAWKGYVEHGLRTAGAAIIDVSGAGGATLWELAKSMEHIPHERICILSSDRADLSTPIAPGITIIKYALDEDGISDARYYLAEWAARMAFELHGAEPPMIIGASPLRREIHPLHWVMVFFALVFWGLGFGLMLRAFS